MNEEIKSFLILMLGDWMIIFIIENKVWLRVREDEDMVLIKFKVEYIGLSVFRKFWDEVSV